MSNKLNNVRQLAEKFGQEHLLKFINAIPNKNREKLINQIMSIDFKLIDNLYNNAVKGNIVTELNTVNITPLYSDILVNYDESAYKTLQYAGQEQISRGKIAAVTLAGGQGTRLGHKGPKGTFRIEVTPLRTLFQLQAERLTALSQKCGKWIPWYIMTSEENHIETLEYFYESKFFRYPDNNIIFFTQKMLPIVSISGKILLKQRDEVYFAPNGNGGVFFSLSESKTLDDMENRGIEWVFICGIDNALVKMADPVFIGYSINSGKPAASKSVIKKYPGEKVGVFCKKNNKPSIVEYTELPEEYRTITKDDGDLLYGDANIIAHLFQLKTLKNISKKGLPYHTAIKNVPYIDDSGEIVKPEKPNAFKFETFIFDAFEYLEDLAILRVERNKEFAPIKNCTGEDSPETARILLEANQNEELL